MPKINYEHFVKKTITEIDQLAEKEDDQFTRQCTIVSASLSNYLPEISWGNHKAIFKEVLLSQRLSYFDQSQEYLLKQSEIIGITPDQLLHLKKAPCIICTYHYGSYRLINLYLTKMAIPFALVVSKSVMNKQGSGINSLHDLFRPKDSNSDFTIIDAEAHSSALQMLRALKSGKSLVVYIDGNTGAGDSTFDSANCLEIPFLDKTIKARKGVATLSYISKVPILPLVSFRKSRQKNLLQFGNSINPAEKSDKDEFVRLATSRLFSFIQAYIQNHPGQWESLLYLHKFAVSGEHKTQNRVEKTTDLTGLFKFNNQDFGLFKMNDKKVLLKKVNYTSFVINSQQYDFLKKTQHQAVPVQDLNLSFINELISGGVLITE